jgi:putative redox protein
MSEANETKEYVAAGKQKINHVVARWTGGTRFEAGRPGSVQIPIDTSGKTGPGPVDTLLCALATCSSIDVVEILAKRRTPVATFEVEVRGERAIAIPARLIRVVMTYRITGEGIDRTNAERAIDLAITKYCSVRDSLDPDLPVEWVLILNGE